MSSMNHARSQIRLNIPNRFAPAPPAITGPNQSSTSTDDLNNSTGLTNENTYANVSWHKAESDQEEPSQSQLSLVTVKSA